MRRALVVLLAGVLLHPAAAPATADASGPATAAKPSCAAAKRSVRRAVARKAPRATVRRLRRRATAACAPRPVRPAPPATGSAVLPAAPAAPGGAPAAPAAPGVPSAAPAPDAPPAAPATNGLGVEAYDDAGTSRLSATRTRVRSGALVVGYRNTDRQEHDLWLAGPGGALLRVTELVAPDEQVVTTVQVTPGSWTLLCAVAGHGDMTRPLAVEG